jgi:hypothetical protein
VQKVQVKFDVSPLSLTGRLGQPIVAASIVREGTTQHVVILSQSFHGWVEVRRMVFEPGPLSAHNADIACLELGNALYNFLVTYVGLQELLPVPLD